MKKIILFFAISYGLFACKKQDVVQKEQAISEKVLNQIKEMGFSTENVQTLPEGYLVEGDILLTDAVLESNKKSNVLRVGDEEQYRTTNVVGIPKAITVSISGLPGAYTAALDVAIQRYNNENLAISFSRVAAGGQINLTNAPSGATYLASAGFPSNYNPFNQVLVNAAAIGATPNTDYLATIIAHEIGHCIGFRHTDYANRSYSCGGSAVNEGASNIGAIQVPGTPAAPDPNSWMLACIGTGANRPFNANDKTALAFLYSKPPVGGYKDILYANEQLLTNQFIKSSNGVYMLIMQGDGNLVIYKYGNQPLWSSNTWGKPATKCIMQGDGNLVLYDNNWTPHWDSGTWQYPGSLLVMQNDGNLVIYQNWVPRWSSNTAGL